MRMLLVAVLLAPLPALATDHGHHVSITNSPLHLVLSPAVVELTGEYALTRKVGLAAVGGYGSGPKEIEDEDTGVVEEHDLTIWEVGAQARYYVVGSFDHGMQLGGEVLYLNVSGFESGDVEGSGYAVSTGAFIGYKKTAKFGLTFDAQLGVAYTTASAEASDNSGNSANSQSRSTGALLNLNVGWAF